MGAIFASFVAVSGEHSTATGASEAVNSSFAEFVGIGFPPSGATIVRAEPPRLSAGLLYNSRAALPAKGAASHFRSFFSRRGKARSDVFPAAIGLYGID